MDIGKEPKYKQLMDFIIEYIKNGDLKHNDKIFSENELMDKFDISRHTVRTAINRLVNEGWLYKQQGKGTFVSDPSAHLKNKGKLIGVVITYLKDYIFPDIITGIEEVLSEENYSILLGSTNNKIEKERMVLTNLLNNNLAGLIIEPTKSVFPNPNKDIYQKFIDRGIPIIYIHGHYNNISASYIEEDDNLAGFMATEHLVELGHKNIGGIFKSDDIQGHGRYEGFINCLRKHDLPISEKGTMWFSTEDIGTFYKDESYSKIIIERLSECTAVVCYNDQIALRILEIFDKAGINVPEDYSVIGFDNSKIAESAKLTTIAHPKSALGSKAAKSLIKIINNQNLVIKEKMKPTLIVRESSKKIK